MKRSRRVQLVLLGGVLAGCSPPGSGRLASVDGVYTNNYYIPGAGYYHAPFRGWFSQPYNYYDPQTKRYFFGGQWGTEPHASITNISAPTAAAVQQVAATRTDVSVSRGGFGSTSRSYSTWS